LIIVHCIFNLYSVTNLDAGTSTSYHEIKELTVFRENYAALCNTITDINNLLKYFVQEDIIGLDEEEEIKHTVTKVNKVQKLLSHISGPLRAENADGFYILLNIMKKYGVKATKELSKSLLAKLESADTSKAIACSDLKTKHGKKTCMHNSAVIQYMHSINFI